MKHDVATALAQEIMKEYNTIPADKQSFYSVFAFNKGLRRAEEIAEKLFADSGYHPYTREGAERAALAIRVEREKVEKGL